MKHVIFTFFNKFMSFTPCEMNNTPRDKKGWRLKTATSPIKIYI